jgi:rhamnogalacturonan endolyase
MHIHTLPRRLLQSLWLMTVLTSSTLTRGGVTLQQRDHGVVISNGIVTATIDPTSATVGSLEYDGHELVNSNGGHRNIYFSRDGGEDYERLAHCVGSIANQTPDMVDYSCKHTYEAKLGDKHAWDVDVHFVIRSGVSGIYMYAITSHPASYPDLSVGEWRMVWSTPESKNDWLDTIYVDDARHWVIPSPQDFATAVPVNGPKEVTRLTQGAWAGRLDCKYMYAGCYAQIRTWGFASSDKHLGGFVVLPSTEFFNDGPDKQDLDVAAGTTLLHLNMNHYGGTGFNIPKGQEWTKFYGPWLIYCNSKSTADDCWHDAQNQVKVEDTQWPYNWLRHPDYPQKSARGSVRGRLALRDPLKPDLTSANANIGLASPSDVRGGDFQTSASGYQFWTHVSADGTFDIANVRPGTYTLYAFTNGVVTQYDKADIIVRAGEVDDLDTLDWTVPRAGHKIAWEIGTADRTAAEFAHGKDYYLPLLYQTLAKEVPDPLDFTIGKSDPATDWYYAQSMHEDEGGKLVPAKWRIHFTLADAPAGTSTLTLAFAGADRARIDVDANGDKIETVSPPVQGGNGLVREAVHTKYSYSMVAIPAGHLKAGDNTISLTMSGPGPSYVMYDYLSLETP